MPVRKRTTSKIKMIEPDRSSEPDESLCLSGEVDSYAAAELHGKLGAYLAASTRPRVDVSGLQACDILSLQLLYSAAASVPSELRTQLFSPFPDCLMKSCVELGLPLPSQEPFQHIGILSLEFHVDKLSRPLL